jgi:hypothetical protein
LVVVHQFIDLCFRGRYFGIVGWAAVVIDYQPATIHQFRSVAVDVAFTIGVSVQDEETHLISIQGAIDGRDNLGLKGMALQDGDSFGHTLAREIAS